MISVDPKYHRYLAQLFNRKTFSSISEGNFPQAISSILDLSGYRKWLKEEIIIEDFFEELFDFLLKNYRCEYVYKNILTNEILQQYHSVSSTILTEFRVSNCLADFVVLNGTSCVYEIKTELDTFDRLERQLAAYRKVFDKIYVVTHHSCINSLLSILDDDIGIIYLTEESNLKKKREAISNKRNIIPGIVFDSLRIAESTSLLNKQLLDVPRVPNTLQYSVYRNLFEKLSPEVVHDEMVQILKNRIPTHKIELAIQEIPRSLKLLFLESKFTFKQNNEFFLNMNHKWFI